MGILTDPTASEHYRARLDEYLHRVVDADGTFQCPSGDRCAGSVTQGHGLAQGQLSYVGDRYAAKVDGRSLRVLVVSMQVGDAEAPVTMLRRREQVQAAERPADRTAHMRGVTYALQLLFGLEPGIDGERLDDGTHVLDAYAMANSTLCSNLPTSGKSRRGAPTPTMLRECSVHLRETIRLLEPTVIHTQGRSADTATSTHGSLAAIVDQVDWLDDWTATIRVGGVRAVWCSLPHPSAGPPKAWQWTTSPFYAEAARPALLRARALALSTG